MMILIKIKMFKKTQKKLQKTQIMTIILTIFQIFLLILRPKPPKKHQNIVLLSAMLHPPTKNPPPSPAPPPPPPQPLPTPPMPMLPVGLKRPRLEAKVLEQLVRRLEVLLLFW